jgi:hypothetical protein
VYGQQGLGPTVWVLDLRGPWYLSACGAMAADVAGTAEVGYQPCPADIAGRRRARNARPAKVVPGRRNGGRARAPQCRPPGPVVTPGFMSDSHSMFTSGPFGEQEGIALSCWNIGGNDAMLMVSLAW